jgi:hypothetical protein
MSPRSTGFDVAAKDLKSAPHQASSLVQFASETLQS